MTSSPFDTIARWASIKAGKSSTFIICLSLIIIWALSGPFFHFSDTWQLVINTGTTLITTLLVLLIQHTQNLNDMAVQLKLDEIIRAVDKARNEFVAIENRSEREIDNMSKTSYNDDTKKT